MLFKLGNNILYITGLCITLIYLLNSSLNFYFPKALVPLLVIIGALSLFSFGFAASKATSIIYSLMYVSSLLTVLFSYRFPEKSIYIILFLSCAFSGLVVVGFWVEGSAPNFLISRGIDTNFVGFFIISGLFVIMKYTVCSLRMKKFLFILFLMSGILLSSRMVVLMFCFLGTAVYWNKSWVLRVAIVSLSVGGLYFAIGFFAENSILVESVISALFGDFNISGLDADKRRVGLLATGVSYVAEAFPGGSGLGPLNYKLAVISEGLAPAGSFRLGYPHNYFISIVAQVGFVGVIFLIYLLRICYFGLRSFPIIAIICCGLAFNEFIGVHVLWLFIGLYFNETVLRSSDNALEE